MADSFIVIFHIANEKSSNICIRVNILTGTMRQKRKSWKA